MDGTAFSKEVKIIVVKYGKGFSVIIGYTNRAGQGKMLRQGAPGKKTTHPAGTEMVNLRAVFYIQHTVSSRVTMNMSVSA